MPNPFTGHTFIRYRLAQRGEAQLAIYDAGGRVVRRLVQADLRSGAHSVLWKGDDEQGRRVPAGVYYLRLMTKDTGGSMPVLLVR